MHELEVPLKIVDRRLPRLRPAKLTLVILSPDKIWRDTYKLMPPSNSEAAIRA